MKTKEIVGSTIKSIIKTTEGKIEILLNSGKVLRVIPKYGTNIEIGQLKVSFYGELEIPLLERHILKTEGDDISEDAKES